MRSCGRVVVAAAAAVGSAYRPFVVLTMVVVAPHLTSHYVAFGAAAAVAAALAVAVVLVADEIDGGTEYRPLLSLYHLNQLVLAVITDLVVVVFAAAAGQRVVVA